LDREPREHPSFFALSCHETFAFASSMAVGGTDLLKGPFGSGKPSSLAGFASHA